MSINQPQTGVDDSPEIPAELFDCERSRIAIALSNAVNGSPAGAQEFAKRGCPLSWRSMIWRRILGVRVDDIDVMYYDQLKTHVLQHELLVDSLVYKDIKLTATNDDQYFVFEDYLYQVTNDFMRPTPQNVTSSNQLRLLLSAAWAMSITCLWDMG